MLGRGSSRLRAFAADERGAMAPLFGIMLTVILFMGGMALDYGRVIHAETKLRAAADGAALAAGRALMDGRLSDAQVRQLAVDFFNANAPGGKKFASVKGVSVTLDRAAGSVSVNVDADVAMTITRINGFTTTDTDVVAAVASDQRDIELGLALDITGSMSGQKITDLKTAAKDLIDILLPDGGTPNLVRIGLAPYAESVNAGTLGRTVTNGASTNGCVYERGGAEAFTDAAPGRGTWLGFARGLTCPSATVVPMTTDKSTLKRSIDGYRANGNTAGHIGAAWAWYLVSPEWASLLPTSSRPQPYADGKTIKAVVLMTDGEFNTEYVRGNGSSDSQARSVCATMKRQNVVVYTVGFMSPRAAENLLQNCASGPDHYFNASNGAELRAAFIEIAQQLNNLRLTQ